MGIHNTAFLGLITQTVFGHFFGFLPDFDAPLAPNLKYRFLFSLIFGAGLNRFY